MIYIYYSSIDLFFDEIYFFEKLKELPKELQEKNKRYMRKKDRYLNLLGKLLLKKGLIDLGFSSSMLEEISYNTYGCPYLNDNIYFSISHSGDYAICAISDNCRLGIDIEECREINFDSYNIAMNSDEWKIICNSKKSNSLFFRFWTIKEAFIKGLQRGMSIPINKIEIDTNKLYVKYNNDKWFFKHITIVKNYTCTLATCYNISNNFICIRKYEDEIMKEKNI